MVVHSCHKQLWEDLVQSHLEGQDYTIYNKESLMSDDWYNEMNPQ